MRATGRTQEEEGCLHLRRSNGEGPTKEANKATEEQRNTISADLGLPQGEKPPEVDEKADFKQKLK